LKIHCQRTSWCITFWSLVLVGLNYCQINSMNKISDLNSFLLQKPSKPLYHYTTQRGLLGIIDSKKMWVTHTQYLNDRREFVHAVELVKKELDRRLEVEQVEGTRDLLLFMQRALGWGAPEKNSVCVCSFSEDRDSLSQWRAYGGVSGYAIGFPPDVLYRAAFNKRWFLAPCIYLTSEQLALVEQFVDTITTQNAAMHFTDEETQSDGRLLTYGANLLAQLNRFAPVLKDKHFAGNRHGGKIAYRFLFATMSFHTGF
jgi:hypothetical protein